MIHNNATKEPLRTKTREHRRESCGFIGALCYTCSVSDWIFRDNSYDLSSRLQAALRTRPEYTNITTPDDHTPIAAKGLVCKYKANLVSTSATNDRDEYVGT